MWQRIVVGVSGGGAALIAGWGILTSLGGLPQLSPRRNFISELATRWNPLADRLNTCLQIAGVLVVVFGLVSLLHSRSRPGRIAAALTAIAGACLSLVGVYSIARMTPHLVAALGLGTCALAASIASMIAARRSAPRALARAATGCTLSILVVLGVGLGYFLWVSARAWPGSVGGLLAVLPHELPVRYGGEVYNPLAVLEWLFFALLGLQMLGAAAAHAAGVSHRAR